MNLTPPAIPIIGRRNPIHTDFSCEKSRAFLPDFEHQHPLQQTEHLRLLTSRNCKAEATRRCL